MDFPIFNAVDIIAILAIFVGTIRGARSGLTIELARMLSVVISLAIAYRAYPMLGQVLTAHAGLAPTNAQALAFVAMLVGSYCAIHVVRSGLNRIMYISFKDNIERAGGSLTGCICAIAVVSAIIFGMGLWSHPKLHETFAKHSLLGRTLHNHVPTAYRHLAKRYPRLPQPQPEENEENLTADSSPPRVRGYTSARHYHDSEENN